MNGMLLSSPFQNQQFYKTLEGTVDFPRHVFAEAKAEQYFSTNFMAD
jgi:hypothetical protein